MLYKSYPTAWTYLHGIFVFLYIFGRDIGDLGWGPRIRHLVFTTSSRCSFGVEIMLQEEDCRRIHTHIGHLNGSKGRHTRPYGNFTAIYNRVEAWYKWQTGQDRQSGRLVPRDWASERRPKGIFPPVDVVRALLPGGVPAVLPLTSPLEVFCT